MSNFPYFIMSSFSELPSIIKQIIDSDDVEALMKVPKRSIWNWIPISDEIIELPHLTEEQKINFKFTSQILHYPSVIQYSLIHNKMDCFNYLIEPSYDCVVDRVKLDDIFAQILLSKDSTTKINLLELAIYCINPVALKIILNKTLTYNFEVKSLKNSPSEIVLKFYPLSPKLFNEMIHLLNELSVNFFTNYQILLNLIFNNVDLFLELLNINLNEEILKFYNFKNIYYFNNQKIELDILSYLQKINRIDLFEKISPLKPKIEKEYFCSSCKSDQKIKKCSKCQLFFCDTHLNQHKCK